MPMTFLGRIRSEVSSRNVMKGKKPIPELRGYNLVQIAPAGTDVSQVPCGGVSYNFNTSSFSAKC